MNKQNIKAKVAELEKRVKRLEAQNQPVSKPTSKAKLSAERMEVSQAAYQAALASFQTTRNGGKCLSLNAAPVTKDQLVVSEKPKEHKGD